MITLLLLSALSWAGPGSVAGYSGGFSTPDGGAVTAISRYGGGYAVILNEEPRLWYWDGAGTWSELDVIADSGEAHALTIFKNNLYVGGHFADADGSTFALGVYKSTVGDTTAVLGPCAGSDCGTVYAMEPVDEMSALDGLWLGGADLVGDGTGAVWPVLQLAPAGPDFLVRGGGLGNEATGPADPTVYALHYGLDPGYDTGSDAESMAAVGRFAEDLSYGIVRYHPFGTYPGDLDRDGWVPVGQGVIWSGYCPSVDGVAVVCADPELAGVAYFQGELYASGSFVGVLPGLGASPVYVPGLLRWDGATFTALSDGDAPVLEGFVGGHGPLLADGDATLYIASGNSLLTPERVGGLLRYDGAELVGLQGGLWSLDPASADASSAVAGDVEVLFLEDDGQLTIGGSFTFAGRLGADRYSSALLPASGLTQWMPDLACAADLNQDGVVNTLDLSRLWTASDGEVGAVDQNADGAVDADDATLIEAAWGACP